VAACFQISLCISGGNSRKIENSSEDLSGFGRIGSTPALVNVVRTCCGPGKGRSARGLFNIENFVEGLDRPELT
jgi:hypothetical protein